MTVEFKSPVSSSNVNQAFLDKNQDTGTQFKLALNRTGSGDPIADTQQAINDNATNLEAHEASYIAHREFDTKANLDTWATTADNGSFAFATDEKKSYQVIDGVLTEIGGGGGGLNEWITLTDYVIGDVIWLAADNKIYRCTADNSDATFTPANWQELSGNFLDGYFTVTPLDNITYTDAESTKLLKKENYELYFQDWKDALPTDIFSSVSASLTVNDAVGDEVQIGMATITQSSASTSDSAEIVIILPTLKADWHLTPIKIQELLEVNGGSGTFAVSIQSSTDGVSFSEVGSVPELNAGITPYKNILQLASDATHLKIKHSVLTPDDTTSLIVHRIHISSDAFLVGQTTIKAGLALNGFLSRSSNRVRLKTQTLDNPNNVLLLDNATFTKITAVKNCSVVLTVSGSRAAGASTIQAQVLNSAGTVLFASEDTTQGANNFGSATLTYELNAGDYLQFLSGDDLVDNTGTSISVTATAYADNVIVDAAVSGLNILSWNPTVVGFGATTNKIAQYAQSGNRLVGFYRGTGGTTAVTEFRISLPNGYTCHSAYTENTIVGTYRPARTDASEYALLALAGNNYLTVGYQSSGASTILVNQNGNVINNNATDFGITFDVAVNELDMSSQLISLDVSSERGNDYGISYDNAGSISNVRIAGGFTTAANVTRLATGRTQVVFNTDFFGATPIITPSTKQTNNYYAAVEAESASSFIIETRRSDTGGLIDTNVRVHLTRSDSDWRAPQAFVANAVSIDSIITDGLEHKLVGKKFNGSDIYYKHISGSTANATVIATDATQLVSQEGCQISGTTELAVPYDNGTTGGQFRRNTATSQIFWDANATRVIKATVYYTK